MTSVSPSSSVSRVAGEDRVGLEIPQAPSFILGSEFALADSGIKLRITEAYYLAVAKVCEARVVLAVGASSGVGTDSVVESEAVSVASSGSRRRRRRRSAEARVRRAAESSDEHLTVPGLSYLAMVEPASRYAVRAELGLSPTLARLLSCPREWFYRGDKLREVKCAVGPGVVDFGVDGLRDAVDVLSHVVVEFRTGRGSFGAELFGKTDLGLVVNQDYRVDRGAEVEMQQGFCYLDLFKAQFVSCAKRAGSCPQLRELLKMPGSWFRHDVLTCRVDIGQGEVLHVHSFGELSVGRLFTEAMLSSDEVFLSGTLGGLLSRAHCKPTCVLVTCDWAVGVPSDLGLTLCSALAALSSLNMEDFDQYDVDAVAGRVPRGFLWQDRSRALRRLGEVAVENIAVSRWLRTTGVQAVEDRTAPLVTDAFFEEVFRSLRLGQYVVLGDLSSVVITKMIVGLVYQAGSTVAVEEFVDVPGLLAMLIVPK